VSAQFSVASCWFSGVTFFPFLLCCFLIIDFGGFAASAYATQEIIHHSPPETHL